MIDRLARALSRVHATCLNVITGGFPETCFFMQIGTLVCVGVRQMFSTVTIFLQSYNVSLNTKTDKHQALFPSVYIFLTVIYLTT